MDEKQMNNIDRIPFIVSGRGLAEMANALSSDLFNRQSGGTWSVAETLQHLFLSARPVFRLMTGPREVFRQWPEANGLSRLYDEIADLYCRVLRTGMKAPEALSPRVVDMAVDQATVIGRFVDVYESLAAAVIDCPDDDMDQYCIPHTRHWD